MVSKSALFLFVVLLGCWQLELVTTDAEYHPQLKTVKPSHIPVEELNSNYWQSQAQSTLQSKLRQTVNNNRAKNIILFLGDGMSMATVTSTRAFIQDLSAQLSFEKFPYVGLSKTYCVDKTVADSACSATAYLNGVKGNYGTIGVNARVTRYDCQMASDVSRHTESIARWAQKAGKSTGFVTTTRVTHASPAGLYAHTANRDWENDYEVRKAGCDPDSTEDIAEQLVRSEVGKAFNVILGGGRAEFRNETVADEEGLLGLRTDGKDLITTWLESHKSMGKSAYVWDRMGLIDAATDHLDYLLGLFSADHCPFHGDIERNGLQKSKPTLSEMTEAAIQILQKNEKGFFLFVEGGRIDHAHHETRAKKALEDTAEFARAVQMARDMLAEEDTLIVATSDHAHTMTLNGYPERRSDILGFSGSLGDDELPFEILSYANGPGFHNTYNANDTAPGRRDPSDDDIDDSEYEHLATVPLASETHGGEDVAVFASGPRAHHFVGSYEESNIPVILAYAAEIGMYSNGGNFMHGYYFLGIIMVLGSLFV